MAHDVNPTTFSLRDGATAARFVAQRARHLDPGSRYVGELLALVRGASSPEDLAARLDDGCRGRTHAGALAFSRMSLEEKLVANLITSESRLFRFDEQEERFLCARLAGVGRVLVAPCARGEEIASLLCFAGQRATSRFSVVGVDVQPAIARAARAAFARGAPAGVGVTPAVEASVRHLGRRVRIRTADIFEAHLGGAYDLVLCRNFLGYFVEPRAVVGALRLARAVARGGSLLLDRFCVAKFPSLVPMLAAEGLVRDAHDAVFVRS